MKNALLTLGFSVLALSILFAQAPEKINYQALARDPFGNPIISQSINMRFTIHSGTPTGTTVYQETHSATTDEQGVFSLEIGGGTVISGVFSDIDWGSSSHFLQIEMDFQVTGYVDMGTTQLISVPYALYAKRSGAVSGTQGYVPVFGSQGDSLVNSSVIFNSSQLNNVGIGTTTPGSNAILDISSNNKGVLLPRLNTIQINNIAVSLADQGLLVYNIDTHSFWFWDGTNWVQM